MKIVCHREGLLTACQLASVASASRDVKPILKNLKAVVDGERHWMEGVMLLAVYLIVALTFFHLPSEKG